MTRSQQIFTQIYDNEIYANAARTSKSCLIVCRSTPRMSTRNKKVTYTNADASYSRNMLQNLLQSRKKTRVPRVLKSTTGGWCPNWFRE